TLAGGAAISFCPSIFMVASLPGCAPEMRQRFPGVNVLNVMIVRRVEDRNLVGKKAGERPFARRRFKDRRNERRRNDHRIAPLARKMRHEEMILSGGGPGRQQRFDIVPVE